MKRTALALLLATAAAHVAAPAHAGDVCYGFDQQVADHKYRIGDTVVADHLKVTFTDYEFQGVKANPGEQYVLVRGSNLTRGRRAPEMYSYMANMQIVPREPVAEITFRIGDNHGGTGNGHANIGVNGSRQEVIGGLTTLDGQLIGAPGKRARVHIEATPNKTEEGEKGHWWVGKMRVRAVDGKIESFLIGGRPGIIDDVCFSTDRP